MTTPASSDATAAAGASRWTVAIFALIGLGVALVAFAFRTPTYQAEALVSISTPAGPIQDEIATVTGPTVIDAATAALGFRPDVTVTAAEFAELLTITATDDAPQDAANAANAVASIYVQAQVGANATVREPAKLPTSQSGLPWPFFAVIGTAVGAALGALLSYVQLTRASRRKQEHANIRPTTDRTAPTPPPGLLPATRGRRVPETPDDFADLADTSNDTRAFDNGMPAPDIADFAELAEPADETPAPPIVEQTEPSTELPDETPALPIAAAGDDAPRQPLQQLITRLMDTSTPPDAGARSFSDAATTEGQEPVVSATQTPQLQEPIVQESWLDEGPTSTANEQLLALERRAIQSQFESARYELVLEHDEQMARHTAEHERQTSDLRSEISSLNKQVRMQAVRLKNRSGTDQTRVGDLEAQVDALELELAALRQSMETERISHAQRITEEQGAADRALDNARRQYREELAKHVHTHRQSMGEHRGDLDQELADERSNHAAALEQQHVDYEQQLEAERVRAETKLSASAERHERELGAIQTATRQELDRQAAQHKETISTLRGVGENSDLQLREIEKENRLLRVEIASLQKQGRHNDNEQASLVQRLSDELAIMRGELDGERERNAALRSDVLRRSAEAHQAIDQAVEERTAQLAELEASVGRQRDYADARVREVSAAAEEQARQAATREASLTANISRLKRELEESKAKNGH